MKTIITLILALSIYCHAGVDPEIDCQIKGWNVSIYTVGDGDNNVLTRVTLSHPKHKGDATMHIPGEGFNIIWDYLERIKPQKTSKSPIKLNLNSDYVHITDVSGYRLITSPEAITLICLWIDCHRQNWHTPKSDQYVKEYQGPQHEILQKMLREGHFPPDITKIRQTEQTAPSNR